MPWLSGEDVLPRTRGRVSFPLNFPASKVPGGSSRYYVLAQEFSQMSSKQFINRKAGHEYEILNRWEAGIALKGSEVKSIREGRVSFTDSFAHIREGEAYLHNLHIAPYSATGHFAGDPKRERKLLLHKREVQSLAGTVSQKGLTLIPLRIYFRRGMVKVEIGLARGRKLYDKREKLKERDTRRQIQRTLKERSSRSVRFE